MELSPETCRVKPLRRINAIVASCWNYFTIKHDARNHKYKVVKGVIKLLTAIQIIVRIHKQVAVGRELATLIAYILCEGNV